jgi:hypothetical protein
MDGVLCAAAFGITDLVPEAGLVDVDRGLDRGLRTVDRGLWTQDPGLKTDVATQDSRLMWRLRTQD